METTNTMQEKADMKIITGCKPHTREQWIHHQKLRIQEIHDDRESSCGFKFKKFTHLGQNLIIEDIPESWRPYVNTRGPLFRWGFCDEIGGFVKVDLSLDTINENTAKTIDEAIEMFRQSKILKTGLMAVIESKRKFRGEI
jgi:hypothetical protein